MSRRNGTGKQVKEKTERSSGKCIRHFNRKSFLFWQKSYIIAFEQ